ncbi:DUF2249 domain-containing protein [Ralstonia pseudosolanacearum]|uniref:DUF2249 domain-containing protein n=1 Tax=Ralstonia solanacearum TaxID=305 RepID=A0A0S4TWQ1_RALSL|nr:aminotransferase [Ralstonia solanacearum]CUV14444.1 conserved protein of unknown function [Ralstonia solanacearum]
MKQTVPSIQLDLRMLAPRERHPLIFSAFGELDIGQRLELISDHDPHLLRSHFQIERPGQFAWDDVERGPHTWRVAITKVAAAADTIASAGYCCGGGCGGGA